MYFSIYCIIFNGKCYIIVVVRLLYMGNSDIRQIASIEEVRQNSISGQFVAVDASNWLYKYMTTTTRFTDTSKYTNKDGLKLPNLIGVPQGIKKFLKYNVTPVFVFDGKPNDLKSGEIERRREVRNKAEKKANNSTNKKEKSKYQSRSQRLNKDIIDTTKELLDCFSVPYMTAPQAAEAQTSHMAKSDDFDAALSEDYDSLIFGAPMTIRQYTTGDKNIEKMSLDKTLKNRDITYEQLINATILCGTDYNDGVSGVGPKTSLKLVKEHKNINDLAQHLDTSIPNGEEIFNLFKNPPVTNDWPEPTKLNPSAKSIKSYLKEQGIDTSDVGTVLDDIEDNSFQSGLNSF